MDVILTILKELIEEYPERHLKIIWRDKSNYHIRFIPYNLDIDSNTNNYYNRNLIKKPESKGAIERIVYLEFKAEKKTDGLELILVASVKDSNNVLNLAQSINSIYPNTYSPLSSSNDNPKRYYHLHKKIIFNQVEYDEILKLTKSKQIQKLKDVFEHNINDFLKKLDLLYP